MEILFLVKYTHPFEYHSMIFEATKGIVAFTLEVWIAATREENKKRIKLKLSNL